jgi:two-component system response regulator FixJ
MISTKAVIHVIDDDELARHSLAALLAAAQFNVRTYESAVAFLANLRRIEFGCIVTDLYMPSVDGIELIGHLRAGGASTPVIVMSGRGDLSLAVKAMRAGAIEFLEKPVDADVLVTWLRSSLVYQNATPAFVSPGSHRTCSALENSHRVKNL